MFFYTVHETYYKNTNIEIYFQGSEKVEAIFLDATEYTHLILRPDAFEKMENLRLLAFQDRKGVKSISVPHRLGLLPENLRYILWDGYPLKTLPPTSCLEMLVELSLKQSHVEKLWNGVVVSMIHVIIFIYFKFFI
jgi:hypothetical protein